MIGEVCLPVPAAPMAAGSAGIVPLNNFRSPASPQACSQLDQWSWENADRIPVSK